MPDPVAGYYVYRAATASGPFTRLTTGLLSATSYTNPLVSSNIYMVRAVNLEVSASGSYSNASQGIFQSLNPTFGAPTLVLFQPTNNATFLAPATIQLNANTFDPANSITNVTFYTNGVALGEFTAPPYSLAWSNVPVGIYSVSAQCHHERRAHHELRHGGCARGQRRRAGPDHHPAGPGLQRHHRPGHSRPHLPGPVCDGPASDELANPRHRNRQFVRHLPVHRLERRPAAILPDLVPLTCCPLRRSPAASPACAGIPSGALLLCRPDMTQGLWGESPLAERHGVSSSKV